MPVPEALCRLSQDPDFWSTLLTDEAVGPSTEGGDGSAAGVPDELRISLPVAGGYGLVLDVDLGRGEQTLGLRQPVALEPAQLGWAAPGLPHPAVLRWSDLDLCGRVIALDDPLLPHPGLVVALLSRFAPATDDDDAAVVEAVRAAAYRSLRRAVAPVAYAGPEQTPLPLFADESWWRGPAGPSGQVLSEDTIATFLTPVPRGPGARRDAAAGLTELVRHARDRLSRLPQEPWYDPAHVLPLARRIAATGDLRPVVDLLGALTEAGCDHPTVLDALSEPLVPVEACWMVETLAGAEPGSILRRHLLTAAV